MIKDLTITKFRDGLRRKEFSALEITRAYLQEIERRNPELNAYLTVDSEGALRQAEEVDAALARGEELPPLAGVPVAIKDIILIKGLRATGASKILEHYTASYDAGCVKKLRAQQAVLLGKTNCDEFAMGSSGENSAYGPTKNPRDLTRVPGGSSSGSAAAVAADMALGSLGTDTGSSVRLPASFCGVVGLRTTYGSVSRSGVMAMTSSLDQVGPFAKNVEDAALLFRAIAGRDPLDATSNPQEYGEDLVRPDWEKIKKLTVGLPKEYFIDGIEPEVRKVVTEVVETYRRAGIKIKDISLPHTKDALATYYIIVPAEISANLARYDGIRYGRTQINADKTQIGADGQRKSALLDLYFQDRANFGAEPKRRIMLGTFVLSSGYYDAYYAKAQRVRTLIRRDFEEAFKQVDAILTPVSPHLPFKLGEKVNDPLAMYLEDIFMIAVNLAGLPGLSVPARVPPGHLPVGFQLISPHFREADILGLGRLHEMTTANQ
ncbi:MAG: Asp-tRNA(Asn)/Glu-tRNA(Gln) amidotransferase subunit GatA [Candidatus Liptonbacteria bacterium]|nr:Asp-tRNA(Asn)/Glu-tRNA(Gln) amidotransferase subunit GatA [Candidatus Liptonbacteria bacterium]